MLGRSRRSGCVESCESGFRVCSSPQIPSQAQSRQPPLLGRGRQHQVQRPDPGGEQQPDGETFRDLRLSGAVAAPPS